MFYRNKLYESKLILQFRNEGEDYNEKLIDQILISNRVKLISFIKNNHYAKIHTTKYIPMIMYLSFMHGDVWQGMHIPTGIVSKNGKLFKKLYFRYKSQGIARSWVVDTNINSEIDSYTIFLFKIIKILL